MYVLFTQDSFGSERYFRVGRFRFTLPQSIVLIGNCGQGIEPVAESTGSRLWVAFIVSSFLASRYHPTCAKLLALPFIDWGVQNHPNKCLVRKPSWSALDGWESTHAFLWPAALIGPLDICWSWLVQGRRKEVWRQNLAHCFRKQLCVSCLRGQEASSLENPLLQCATLCNTEWKPFLSHCTSQDKQKNEHKPWVYFPATDTTWSKCWILNTYLAEAGFSACLPRKMG